MKKILILLLFSQECVYGMEVSNSQKPRERRLSYDQQKQSEYKKLLKCEYSDDEDDEVTPGSCEDFKRGLMEFVQEICCCACLGYCEE